MRALLLAAVTVAALFGAVDARAQATPDAPLDTRVAVPVAGCVVDLERAAFESVVDSGTPLEAPARVDLCADPSDPTCSSLPASNGPGGDLELAELVRFLDDTDVPVVPACQFYRTLGRSIAPGLAADDGTRRALERPPHRG